jgi:hypothetical protein
MKTSRILLYFFLFTRLISFGLAGESVHRDDDRLDMLKEAFRAYAVKNGAYPAGSNWEIVRQLTDPYHGIGFKPTKTDVEGNLLDVSGQPYLFLFSRNRKTGSGLDI